jgi:hypothetical protein
LEFLLLETTSRFLYLNIHFSKKDEIKDYLGKWDKDNKLWYVPKVMYTQLKKEISKIGDVIIWDNKYLLNSIGE